jgi:hypothetical protein
MMRALTLTCRATGMRSLTCVQEIGLLKMRQVLVEYSASQAARPQGMHHTDNNDWRQEIVPGTYNAAYVRVHPLFTARDLPRRPE